MTNAQRVKELCKTIEWVAMSHPAGLAEIRAALDRWEPKDYTVTATVEPAAFYAPMVVPTPLPNPWADTRDVAEAADKILAISPPTVPTFKRRGRKPGSKNKPKQAGG